MSDETPYTQYYLPPILTGQKGFKLVPGGTGIGKTSAIPATIQQGPPECKYIYCTNRVQLLDEMEGRLEKAGVQSAHLRRDREIVQRLLDSSDKRRGFYRLLDSELVASICTVARSRGRSIGEPHHIHRLCEELRYRPSHMTESLRELFDSHARRILSFWRNLLHVASDNGKGQAMSAWYELVQHPIIRHLFPYLPFKNDPSVRILLVTIQKLYRGFFDGRKQVDIFRLEGEDGERIIFLDEFDFLEGNLIDILCEETTIRAPFYFVEQFYRTMTRDKLPLDDYPVNHAALRGRIEGIIGQIEHLRKQGIPFPDLVQFTFRDAPSAHPPVIFQTNRTILEEPLFFEAGERAWHLVPEAARSGNDALNALDLFQTIHHVTYQILKLFKDLEVSNRTVYDELRRQCFEHTVFYDEVQRVHQLPRPRTGQVTGFDSLLEAGYGFYELKKLQQETDPSVVEWAYFSLYSTPDAILATLAEHNLVFGLSATAKLPRYLGGFNLDWLGMQEGVVLHPITEAEYELIRAVNERKKQSRANTIETMRAEELDRTNPFQRQLIESIRAIATEEGFGKDDSGGFRRRRVERFFGTLLWIAQQQASDAHLLFFTSYRQIEYLFQAHPFTGDDPPLWEIRLQEYEGKSHDRTAVFRYYEMDFAGTSFVVIFYNAERAQQLERDEISQKHYNQAFWLGKPVVVVTTYPSAGNGVNLQYLPSPDSVKGEETDFGGIHLLDSPFYYFDLLSDDQTARERRATIKKNVWYLAKLFEAKLISNERFRRFLSHLRKQDLNGFYYNDSATATDALLNRLATLMQALGRIERVWQPLPNQTVRLSRDEWETIAAFVTEPTYGTLHDAMRPVLSSNLTQVLEQVSEQQVGMRRRLSELRDERLPQQELQSRESIDRLLQRLSDLRRGEPERGAREEWEELRRAVLRHDFQHSLLQEYHCVFESAYAKTALLYVTREHHLVPEHVWDGTIRIWNPSRIYEVVASNTIIRRYFERQGYELAFRAGSSQIFTPYCYQSILAGAIGEEGIRALLRHEGIRLEKLADSLYELADLKIMGQPWYLDCKNYGEPTLEAFPLQESDPAWRPNLNDASFRTSAQRKLAAITSFHGDARDACKLIYLNLASTDGWVRQYLDASYTPVERFQDAAIIVIPGVLQRDHADQYTTAFSQLLPHLKHTTNWENL